MYYNIEGKTSQNLIVCICSVDSSKAVSDDYPSLVVSSFRDERKKRNIRLWDTFWQNNRDYIVSHQALDDILKNGFYYAKDALKIARFIWNAEISVSVAIYSYECLF